MTLLERNKGIARRAEDLGDVAGRIADILRAGKRDQLLAGVDAAGRPFAPLSPATLSRKGRTDPRPLIPLGESSSLIVGYVVDTSVETSRLIVSAGWPGRPEVQYLRSGTRRMPARDPGGFRAQDLEQCRGVVRAHVMEGPDRG